MAKTTIVNSIEEAKEFFLKNSTGSVKCVKSDGSESMVDDYPEAEAFFAAPIIAPSGAWKRYRFQSKSVQDYRPLIYNPKYPYWLSGESETEVTIIAYLPANENLLKYWDDATNIEFTEEKEIVFTSRFPKPVNFV